MQRAPASSRDEVHCGRGAGGRTGSLSPSLPALLPVSLPSLLFAFFLFLFCSVLLCPPRGPGNAGHSRLFPGSFQTGGISPECRAPFLFPVFPLVSLLSLFSSHRGQVKRTRQGDRAFVPVSFGPGLLKGPLISGTYPVWRVERCDGDGLLAYP